MSKRRRYRHPEGGVKVSGPEFDPGVGNDLQAQAEGRGGGRRKPSPESGRTSSDHVPASLSSSY